MAYVGSAQLWQAMLRREQQIAIDSEIHRRFHESARLEPRSPSAHHRSSGVPARRRAQKLVETAASGSVGLLSLVGSSVE